MVGAGARTGPGAAQKIGRFRNTAFNIILFRKYF
jgi:hypothetical protein